MFSHSNCCLLLLVWGIWITKALFSASICLPILGDRDLLSVSFYQPWLIWIWRVLQREGLGQAQTRCVGGSTPAELPSPSTAATVDPSWSISVQGLQIVTVPAPSPSAETHQPQTRGSWQCLKLIIFSHGKQLTCKPTSRAWACCCCCSTWLLNWVFNWFLQPVFQV